MRPVSRVTRAGEEVHGAAVPGGQPDGKGEKEERGGRTGSSPEPAGLPSW